MSERGGNQGRGARPASPRQCLAFPLVEEFRSDRAVPCHERGGLVR
jgi:hypothetical protein